MSLPSCPARFSASFLVRVSFFSTRFLTSIPVGVLSSAWCDWSLASGLAWCLASASFFSARVLTSLPVGVLSSGWCDWYLALSWSLALALAWYRGPSFLLPSAWCLSLVSFFSARFLTIVPVGVSSYLASSCSLASGLASYLASSCSLASGLVWCLASVSFFS